MARPGQGGHVHGQSSLQKKEMGDGKKAWQPWVRYDFTGAPWPWSSSKTLVLRGGGEDEDEGAVVAEAGGGGARRRRGHEEKEEGWREDEDD